MNKKLIAAAIAAAVVASPVAFAESTVYGKMHTSIDAIDYESTNEDNYEMNSRASRLGFKGSEDLGNGLKAIYQMEFSVSSDGNDGADGQDGGDGWGGQRNTFIGLAGDWGTFLVGRHDTPAKMAFYAAGNERLGDSVIDLNLGNNLSGAPNFNSPVGVFHEYRADNAIAYVSPNFSGFTIAAAMIPGEDNDVSGSRDGIADHYSVGAMYKGNGLKAGIGYSSYDLDAPGNTYTAGTDGDSMEVLQAGASYTMNNFSFGAHYETVDNQAISWANNVVGVPAGTTLGNKDNDYDAWAVTGKYTFGNNAVSAVYTDASYDFDTNGNDIDRDGWGLAAEHNFSKRTKVYAAYASGTVEYDTPGVSDDDNDVFSLGMIHNF